jgi:hypothetical protein
MPVIAAGKGLTVTTAVAIQPVDNVYVITGVPAAIPLTTPVGNTVASNGSPLLQLPPVLPSLNVVVNPGHTLITPVITDGNGFTVIGQTALQPPGKVYIILGVPVATPLTIPVVEPTVALERSLLLHVPPPVASASVVVEPTHTVEAPVTTAGDAFTLTTVVVKQPAGNV